MGYFYKLQFLLKVLLYEDNFAIYYFVRELLAATRKLERDVYLAQRNYERYLKCLMCKYMYKCLCSNIDELDKHLTQHKAWLADASIKLSLTIRFVHLLVSI